MHDSVAAFVSRKIRQHDLARGSVLDVGSFDVNGNLRGMFAGARYLGVDMRPGPNVDRVVNAHDLVAEFGPASFDTVVCCEVLEHDPEFWTSMAQMGEVLKPGGRMLVTTRGIAFPLHEFPDDLWRFTLSAGKRLAELAGLIHVEVTEDMQAPGIFIDGRKP